MGFEQRNMYRYHNSSSSPPIKTTVNRWHTSKTNQFPPRSSYANLSKTGNTTNPSPVIELVPNESTVDPNHRMLTPNDSTGANPAVDNKSPATTTTTPTKSPSYYKQWTLCFILLLILLFLMGLGVGLYFLWINYFFPSSTYTPPPSTILTDQATGRGSSSTNTIIPNYISSSSLNSIHSSLLSPSSSSSSVFTGIPRSTSIQAPTASSFTSVSSSDHTFVPVVSSSSSSIPLPPIPRTYVCRPSQDNRLCGALNSITNCACLNSLCRIAVLGDDTTIGGLSTIIRSQRNGTSFPIIFGNILQNSNCVTDGGNGFSSAASAFGVSAISATHSHPTSSPMSSWVNSTTCTYPSDAQTNMGANAVVVCTAIYDAIFFYVRGTTATIEYINYPTSLGSGIFNVLINNVYITSINFFSVSSGSVGLITETTVTTSSIISSEHTLTIVLAQFSSNTVTGLSVSGVSGQNPTGLIIDVYSGAFNSLTITGSGTNPFIGSSPSVLFATYNGATTSTVRLAKFVIDTLGLWDSYYGVTSSDYNTAMSTLRFPYDQSNTPIVRVAPFNALTTGSGGTGDHTLYEQYLISDQALFGIYSFLDIGYALFGNIPGGSTFNAANALALSQGYFGDPTNLGVSRTVDTNNRYYQYPANVGNCMIALQMLQFLNLNDTSTSCTPNYYCNHANSCPIITINGLTSHSSSSIISPTNTMSSSSIISPTISMSSSSVIGCNSSPCLNGGTCSDVPNGCGDAFTCSCTSSLYSGRICTSIYTYTQYGNINNTYDPSSVGDTPTYGVATAISGDGMVAVVGAPNANTIYSETGEVYVYIYSPITKLFVFSYLLITSDRSSLSQQGSAVSISYNGSTIAISAPADNSYIGAVWVFKRIGISSNWIQQGTKLIGTGYVLGVGNAIGIGASVSLSGDGLTLFVGGSTDSGGIGAVWEYIFDTNAQVWNQLSTKFVASDYSHNPNIGVSVSTNYNGSVVVVGGFNDNIGVGAFWIWIKINGIRTQSGTKRIYAGDSSYSQAYSVKISSDGSTIAVSNSASSSNQPIVYIYTGSITNGYNQVARIVLTGFAGSPTTIYPSIDATFNGTIIAIGVNADNSGQGATWIITKSIIDGSYSQQGSKIITSDTSQVRNGCSVSIDGNGGLLLIGAYLGLGGVGAVYPFYSSSFSSCN